LILDGLGNRPYPPEIGTTNFLVDISAEYHRQRRKKSNWLPLNLFPFVPHVIVADPSGLPLPLSLSLIHLNFKVKRLRFMHKDLTSSQSDREYGMVVANRLPIQSNEIRNTCKSDRLDRSAESDCVKMTKLLLQFVGNVSIYFSINFDSFCVPNRITIHS
jgi:hypothetical protein